MNDADKKTIELPESDGQPKDIGWLLVFALHIPECISLLVMILIVAFFDIPEDNTLAVFWVAKLVGFIIVIYVLVYLIARKARQDLRKSDKRRDYPK